MLPKISNLNIAFCPLSSNQMTQKSQFEESKAKCHMNNEEQLQSLAKSRTASCKVNYR